jgi:FkbM family methyltransferase
MPLGYSKKSSRQLQKFSASGGRFQNMPAFQALKRLVSKPLQSLLTQERLRSRLAFELRQNYYSDLEILVPIGKTLRCPVSSSEHWFSFSEMFVEQEYKEAFDIIPLPKRWIDVGCHAGYFSLFVAWMWEKQASTREFQSLLIDADPRVCNAVRKLIDLNELGEHMLFEHGLVSCGEGSGSFALNEVMSSALTTNEESSDNVIGVKIISQQEILRLFPPPYDLIKIDVEGAEHDFLVGYDQLVHNARYLLLEWHSWHTGGGGVEQIKTLAQTMGLSLVKEITRAHTVAHSGQQAQCGVLLLQNDAFPIVPKF